VGILEREPVLGPRLSVWMAAFHTVNAGRHYTIAATMAKAIRLPQPLSVSEILTVADIYGLPRREFLIICQLLDQLYMARQLAKN
jgi:hypothetical protein